MISDTHPLRTPKFMNLTRLGFFLDGWADLVEGYGDKADEIRNEVYKSLKSREMPDVKVFRAVGTAGIGQDGRPYNIATTFPGVSTIVYIGKHGKDILASWYTFVKPVPNWKVLGAIAILAGIIGLQFASDAMKAASQFSNAYFGLISTTQVLLAGLGTFIITTLSVWGAGVLLLAILGYFLIRDPLWVMVIRPNLFDADDIIAMSLSAHKSILRAIDKAGLDSAILRPKQSFIRRKNEEV